MILRETKVELGFNGFNDRNSATRCRVAFYTSQRGASWQPISIEDYIKKGEDSMNHMSQSIIWYWNLYQPLKGYIYIYIWILIGNNPQGISLTLQGAWSSMTKHNDYHESFIERSWLSG